MKIKVLAPVPLQQTSAYYPEHLCFMYYGHQSKIPNYFRIEHPFPLIKSSTSGHSSIKINKEHWSCVDPGISDYRKEPSFLCHQKTQAHQVLVLNLHRDQRNDRASLQGSFPQLVIYTHTRWSQCQTSSILWITCFIPSGVLAGFSITILSLCTIKLTFSVSKIISPVSPTLTKQ